MKRPQRLLAIAWKSSEESQDHESNWQRQASLGDFAYLENRVGFEPEDYLDAWVYAVGASRKRKSLPQQMKEAPDQDLPNGRG